MKLRTGYYSEQTRNEAFNALLNDIPARKEKAIKVFKALESGRKTSHQIAKEINYPVHLLCARLNELRKLGFAIDVDDEFNKETDANNRVWDIDRNKLNQQKELIFK